MNLKEIKELIELINSSDIAYFEVSNNEMSIKMDKSLTRNIGDNISTETTKSIQEINNIVESKANNVENIIKKENIVEEENINYVKSPMVGTFYSASSPEKESFVNVGDKVCKGDILCIIEAMKLMNEIECEFDGELVEVLVKDGEMVEYGQPIFKIRRC